MRISPRIAEKGRSAVTYLGKSEMKLFWNIGFGLCVPFSVLCAAFSLSPVGTYKKRLEDS